MEPRDFVFLDQVVLPGTVLNTSIKVGHNYDFTESHIPVKIINGREAGPIVFISAAIHGDELNGTEIIRRLSHKNWVSNIKGTLILIPIVNVFGFNQQSRYLPDRRDLNRLFPGSPEGSLGSRLAYLFIEEVVKKSHYGIDIHTGAVHRFNLPQIRFNLEDHGVKELASHFRLPVMVHAGTRDGSLREVGEEMGVPVFLIEGGEALRFDENVIRLEVKAIESFLQAVGMINEELDEPLEIESPQFYAKSSSWMRAPVGGTVRLFKNVGDFVEKDEVLGHIADPLGDNTVEFKSRREGVIIGISRLPLVNHGDALVHVASLEAAQGLEDLYEEDNLTQDNVDIPNQVQHFPEQK